MAYLSGGYRASLLACLAMQVAAALIVIVVRDRRSQD
jgi:hypothetical protein